MSAKTSRLVTRVAAGGSNTSSTAAWVGVRGEDEEAVCLDDRAAAWRDRVVVADHDRDDRRAREPELADGGADDRVVGATTKSMRSSSLAASTSSGG